jgi:2-oxoglutarate ferredoxin oxidoreductase subunit beta
MEARVEQSHPIDPFLRTDMFPSMWCSGCGIGTVVFTFIEAIKEARIDPQTIHVISGIGCTGKISDYLTLSTVTTTDGNVVDYAADIKAQHPNDTVVVFSGNVDFLLSGAGDLIEHARKETELLVIHINSLIYTVTENMVIANSPFTRIAVDQQFELPFNMPHLAQTYGAHYVARWTPLRAGWLKYSIIEGMQSKGLAFIEVISPCVMFYVADGRIEEAYEHMVFYDRHSVLADSEATEKCDMRNRRSIVIGEFVRTL